MSKKINEIVSEKMADPAKLDEECDKIAADETFVVDGAVPVAEVDLTKYPQLTSVGITKTDKGWVFFKMVTQNDKVISVDYAQEDLRSTCINNFKVTAQKLFMENI